MNAITHRSQQVPNASADQRPCGNPDEIIGTVMVAAHALAAGLVAEAILVSATLGEATGEASCLTVVVPGETLPFYIQPMHPDLDEADEPCVELYIERDDPEWEPIPFAISVENRVSMESDLQALFKLFA